MKKTLISILLSILCQAVIAQQLDPDFTEEGYRIDSSTTLVANPPFGQFTTVHYVYNEQEQLIRIENDDYTVEITYEDRDEIHTIPEFEYTSSAYLRKTFNMDGFLEVEQSGLLYINGNIVIHQIDSFYRSSDHLVTQHVSYRLSNSEFKPVSRQFYYYDAIGLLDSSYTVYITAYGQEFAKIWLYNAYDSQMRLVETTGIYSGPPAITDKTSYIYDGDILREKLHTNRRGPSLISETREVYSEIEGGLRSTLSKRTVEGEVMDEKQTTDYLYSENRFLQYDSIHVKYTDSNELVDYELYKYEVIENQQKDSLKYVAAFQIKRRQSSTLIGNRRQMFYSRKLPEYVRPEAGQIRIAQNPSLSGQQFLLIVESIEFDAVVIYNSAGQLVSRTSITQPINTLISSPEIPGMYYVQLFNGNKMVSAPAKLVVQ